MLQIINELTFLLNSIQRITIPLSITCISNNSIECCENIQKVETTSDSNIQIIEKNALLGILIQYISIPQNSKEFDFECFFVFRHLKQIKVDKKQPST